jgi:activator of HSP90 ATPase
MSKTIRQTVTFKSFPHLVYEAFMDSALHTAFTGSAASIDRKIDGEFSAYDGYITGKNVELVQDRKIVQSWRAVDWPEGYYSLVTIELTPLPEGTQLDLTHTNVPEGEDAAFEEGWIDNYWEPLKEYLEK